MKTRTLNQTFGWLLATVIIPLLLGALLLLYVQGRQEQRAAQRQLAVLAQTLMQTVDRELAVGREQLEVIAAAPMLQTRDWPALQRFAIQSASRRPGSVVGFVDLDGQQLFNTITDLGGPQPNLWKIAGKQEEAAWEGYSLPVSSQLLTKQVFDRGEPAYSDLYYGLNTRKPALAISIPVKEGGAVRYALTLSFQPDKLQHLIDAVVYEPGLRAVVVDRRGVVMASNAAAFSKLGDKVRPLPLVQGSYKGTYDRVSRDGTSVQAAYAVSSINGFEVRVSRSSQTLVDFVRSATAGWILLVFSALLASVFLASRAARRIGVPLRAMGDAVRNGKAENLPATRITELEVLSAALQSGAAAEKERREALVIEAQRAESVAALQRADAQKDEFLATLAHELRNPLAPIRTATELIKRAAPDDSRVQRPREIIERQVGHMARLVDDLLDVSRITRGTVQLRTQPLDLTALTRHAADAVKPVFATAGVKLLEDSPAETPVIVHGDAMRLTQCVTNLLNNAVKFTPRGGTVQYSVTQADGNAAIRIQDSGIGIAPENLERIFELFAQEHRSGANGNSGLGIGLALTRKLVQLHNGSVTATSHGSDRGSTFSMELPLGLGTHKLTTPFAEEEFDRAIGLGARVLVVDDNVDAADSISEVLRLFGYIPTVAYSGTMACQVAGRSHFDAVLLDIGLPDMSGHEVITQLKKINQSLVVVALTGWGNDADRQRTHDAGFSAHLTKPAEPKAVVRLLNNLLAGRNAHQLQ